MGFLGLFRKKKQRANEQEAQDHHPEIEATHNERSPNDLSLPPLGEAEDDEVSSDFNDESIIHEEASDDRVNSSEWSVYVHELEELDGPILEPPPTEMVSHITPPPASSPPFPHSQTNEPDHNTSVLREEYSAQNEEMSSDRAFGPVFVSSLREAAYLYRRWLIVNTGHASEQAQRMWEAYLELCPEDVEAHVAYGWLMFDLYGIDEASECFRKALKIVDDPLSVLIALGALARRAGDYDAAAKYFTEASERDPRNIDLLYYLAGVQREAGFEHAARETESSIDELVNGGWRGPA